MSTYAPPRWNPSYKQFPPPFQGAPPIPAGVNIPQSHWNQGTWIPNPAYNPQAPRHPNIPQWMPGPAWGSYYGQHPYPGHQQQQQQQQQSFNPYKRQPRPPSAEYLASKLSDNPLGLSNMIPASVTYPYSTPFFIINHRFSEELERQERERQRLDQEQHNQDPDASTPWIWNPRSLDDDDSDPRPNNNRRLSSTPSNTLQCRSQSYPHRTSRHQSKTRQHFRCFSERHNSQQYLRHTDKSGTTT